MSDQGEAVAGTSGADAGRRPTHVVGVGTSAGGLEALSALFARLPFDLGVAYLVVQHLSPDAESMMPDILGRTTDMPVTTATDGTTIEADSIYFIPPGKVMTVEDDRLILEDQHRSDGIQRPIDQLFHSLALDRPATCVGVVLSGTGTDGSRGLKSIKQNDGLVMVEEPTTARFDGMPRAAVGTGVADVVLSLDDLADSLVGYIRHSANGESEQLDHAIRHREGAMQQVFDMLHQNSGIHFADYKPSTLRRRLQHRMGINQVTSLDDYLDLLSSTPRELRALNRDLLIGVTEFFRDRDAFEDLRKVAIPAILDRLLPGEPIRVWSVGCSTGEEAYSLAMVLRETLSRLGDNRGIKVFGTDVDPIAIDRSAEGHYREVISDVVSQQRLAQFFTAVRSGYRVRPELRRDVVFAVHNLLEDPPFSKIDLCVCRNVLIYFEPDVQQRALRLMHFSLKMNGILFLGASETVGDMGAHFTQLSSHDGAATQSRAKLFQKTSDRRLLVDGEVFAGVRDARGGLVSGVPSTDRLLRRHNGVPEGAGSYWGTARQLLDRYVPPSIALDAEHEILHVYGDISRFLTAPRAGQFRPTIENLINEDLAVAVSTGLVRALETEADVVYSGVALREGDETYSVDLRISYVARKTDGRVRYLLTFHDPDRMSVAAAEATEFDIGAMGAQRIADLERELSRSQEHLQVTVEELESANEELQASNEELVSSNEELQSTNEELQSLNEELHTVNAEYQHSLSETHDLHADLRNTIDAIEVGLIFLDAAGQVAKFTPGAARYFHITDADVGRPFLHLSHELQYPELQNDIAVVMLGGERVERESTTRSGEVVVAKLQPYVRNDNTTEGAVVSITTLRNTSARERELLAAYHELRATVGRAMLDETASFRVLVVEDDAADRELVRALLRDEDAPSYEIFEAPDLQTALKVLEHDEVDIALIDQRLPGPETGLEAIIELREQGITCPFILMSSYAEPHLVHEALDLGVYDFVDKADLNSSLLQRCISHAVRDWRTQRYLAEAGWHGPPSPQE